MQRIFLLPLTIVLAAPLGFAQAADRAPAQAIRLDQASHAVLLAHPELAGSALELPVRVEARTGEPVLLAGPVERFSAGAQAPAQERVRLHCQQPSVCLPFYVLVHPVENAAAAVPAPDRTKAVPAATVATPALRSGARASLLIDSGLLHLRIPVTCLQGGAVGSSIRVAVLPHGRVYRADIIDGATVRGSL